MGDQILVSKSLERSAVVRASLGSTNAILNLVLNCSLCNTRIVELPYFGCCFWSPSLITRVFYLSTFYLFVVVAVVFKYRYCLQGSFLLFLFCINVASEIYLGFKFTALLSLSFVLWLYTQVHIFKRVLDDADFFLFNKWCFCNFMLVCNMPPWCESDLSTDSQYVCCMIDIKKKKKYHSDEMGRSSRFLLLYTISIYRFF